MVLRAVTADPGTSAVQLSTVTADLSASRVPLPAADVAFAAPPSSWADLFARLPLALDGPSVIILDEFPWAIETDDTLATVLQHAWDRTLERQPVLMVLMGSDLAMMERLSEHGRPLFGRAQEMVLEALSPAETAQAFDRDRDPLDVVDVFLLQGRVMTASIVSRRAGRGGTASASTSTTWQLRTGMVGCSGWVRSSGERADRWTSASSTSWHGVGGVVPDAGGARLLAVCPAGANDRAAFDAILTAADVLDAFG